MYSPLTSGHDSDCHPGCFLVKFLPNSLFYRCLSLCLSIQIDPNPGSTADCICELRPQGPHLYDTHSPHLQNAGKKYMAAIPFLQFPKPKSFKLFFHHSSGSKAWPDLMHLLQNCPELPGGTLAPSPCLHFMAASLKRLVTERGPRPYRGVM